MHFCSAKVVENTDAGAGYTLLRLGPCQQLRDSLPGQFVMLRGAWGRDPILPRAYSILGVDPSGEVEFLIRQVGRGSRLLGQAPVGTELTVLGPLGNSFPPPVAGTRDLLVAGGCGLPPLHMAALRAGCAGGSVAGAPRAGAERPKTPGAEVLLGARRQEDLVQPLLARLIQAGVPLHLITEDGSSGERGLVTALLERRLGVEPPGTTATRVMACGPTAMLRAVREVARRYGAKCYLSLESEMACGLGACLGCAVERPADHYAHVCADGPVFDAEEIWP